MRRSFGELNGRAVAFATPSFPAPSEQAWLASRSAPAGRKNPLYALQVYFSYNTIISNNPAGDNINGGNVTDGTPTVNLSQD
jgi:hypothetical protein